MGKERLVSSTLVVSNDFSVVEATGCYYQKEIAGKEHKWPNMAYFNWIYNVPSNLKTAIAGTYYVNA